ncbi:MAG TPA: alpha/beta fold hydrolase [Dehalococcoidia bacterium]|nr:alpha/beta fold hydrolase [Dehalococcoidia bacterium]
MLCLFGHPRAFVDGQQVPLRLRPKTWALLARLALSEGACSRRDLAAMLFDEANDSRAALRWHLLDLRRQLPASLAGCLDGERDELRLDAPTDVQTFNAGFSGQPSRADTRAALALYQGDFCENLSVTASSEFDTWLWVEQDKLRRRFRQGVLDFAGFGDPGQSEAAVEHLLQLLRVDPYCEDAHIALIDAWEATGRIEAAREAYVRYEKLVRVDLGAAPRPDVAARYGRPKTEGRELPREGPVPLSNVTLHVVEWPAPGPTVMAIHGTSGSAHSLAMLANRVAPAARFVAPDLRGHGFSDKPPSGYTLAQHVEDIAELIAALNLKRPVLLGFSFGGNIAAEVARQVNIAGLILLEGVIGRKAFFENAAAKTVPAFKALLERHFGGFSEYLEWAAQTPATDEIDAYLKQRAHFDLVPVRNGKLRLRSLTTALLESWRSAAETDTLATLRQLTCPVLIVQAKLPWIASEPYLPDDAFADQMKACPHARIFRAEDSSHATLIRDPEPGLIDALVRFVRECSAA